VALRCLFCCQLLGGNAHSNALLRQLGQHLQPPPQIKRSTATDVCLQC
jgi:hypothetical protein